MSGSSDLRVLSRKGTNVCFHVSCHQFHKHCFNSILLGNTELLGASDFRPIDL